MEQLRQRYSEPIVPKGKGKLPEVQKIPHFIQVPQRLPFLPYSNEVYLDPPPQMLFQRPPHFVPNLSHSNLYVLMPDI